MTDKRKGTEVNRIARIHPAKETGGRGHLLNYSYRVSIALCAILVLTATSPLWLNLPTIANRALAFIGRMSMGMYVVHILLLDINLEVCQHILPASSPFLLCALTFITTTLSSLLAVWAIRHTPCLRHLI